mgnify:CR=1 FL=1
MPFMMMLATSLTALVVMAQVQTVDIAGTWTLEKDPSTRVDFDDKGAFRFSAPSYKSTSAGNYSLSGEKILLTYTEVDGEPVGPGMKLVLVFERGTDSIRLNKFRYVRAKKI